MYKFLLIQYRMGKVTEEKLLSFVPRWITEKQAESILKDGEQAGT